jgi:hypothetical protein
MSVFSTSVSWPMMIFLISCRISAARMARVEFILLVEFFLDRRNMRDMKIERRKETFPIHVIHVSPV